MEKRNTILLPGAQKTISVPGENIKLARLRRKFSAEQVAERANIESDLGELWQRIVFNLFVSNTDDHLRNHGFILTERGWILSPAFDINPNEDGSGLSLNISLDDNSLDLDLTLEVAEYFRLTNEDALKKIENIKKSVKNWRSVANKYQLPESEQELMAKVFERFL